ncbi:flagella basal body P-ring formation protein FlgA [Alteraurantiacibacter aquimixticola]|nr:flagella basal body P-ring formation protein FlgA [Alteraurantiacibacter aquimixticola]
MPRLTAALTGPAALCLLASAPLAAQSFIDHGAIDAEVAAFTGAGIGTPGGARHPVDRRLRLSTCPQQLSLAWHGVRADMVRVECTAGQGWRIFVPVNSGGVTAAVAAAPAQARRMPGVERGQVLTITIQGRGFSVSQQGEALEDGSVGEWIRVRPEGNREAVRARIDTPGRAVIPLG